MTPEQLFKEFEAGFPGRKFSAGLLIAFIDLGPFRLCVQEK
jgi:hypothetical protein